MPDRELFAERYRLEKLLGEGGMGKVWRAVDTTTGTTVALKVLTDEHVRNEQTRKRFFGEAGALARLDHRNIVTIVTFDADSTGRLYLVMEYVDGPSLAEFLESGRREPAEAVAVVRQLANALTVAHRDKLVHRDLKPANVLLEYDGPELRVVLIDFGIAALAERRHGLTADTERIGSAEYMSPERWEGREVDHRSDLYALGVVLFEMLVGRPPFRAATVAALRSLHREHAVPHASQAHPDVPAALDTVIAKAMAKKPEDRFASAAEMAEAAEAALTGRPLPDPDEEKVDKAARRRVVRAVLAAVALVVVACGVVWAFTRPPSLQAEGTIDVGTETTGAVAVVSGSSGPLAFVGTGDGSVSVLNLSGTPASAEAGPAELARIPVGGPPREIVASADGTTVFVSTDRAMVTPIDVASLTAAPGHPTPAGPGRIDTLGAGASTQVYGAGQRDGYQFDPRGTGYRTFGIGVTTSDVAAVDDRTYFLVPDDGTGKARLDILDATTQQLLEPVPGLPTGTSTIAATSNGIVYAAGPRTLVVVDPGDHTVRPVALGSADNLRDISTSDDDVYALTDNGSVLLVRDGAVVATAKPSSAGGPSRQGLAVGPTDCVVSAGGASTIDLLGDGSSCRD